MTDAAPSNRDLFAEALAAALAVGGAPAPLQPTAPAAVAPEGAATTEAAAATTPETVTVGASAQILAPDKTAETAPSGPAAAALMSPAGGQARPAPDAAAIQGPSSLPPVSETPAKSSDSSAAVSTASPAPSTPTLQTQSSPGAAAPSPPPAPAAVMLEGLSRTEKSAATISGVRTRIIEPAVSPNTPASVDVQPLADAVGVAPLHKANPDFTGGGGAGGDSQPDLPTPELVRAAEGGEVAFEPAFLSTEAPVGAEPSALPRANAETILALAAETARKLDARVSRFDLTLTPEGLGTVQVSLEIRDGGEVTAQLHFERSETAAELKGRSAELRSALESAGFNVASGGLNFGSPGGGRERASEPERPSSRAPLFTVSEHDTPPQPAWRRHGAGSGLDLRI